MLNRLLITLFYKLYGGRSTRLIATVVHIVPRPSYALYDGHRTPTFISKKLLVLEIMGSAIKADIHFKK